MTRTLALFILLALLSSEVFAQAPVHLGFDWRKHPTPGNFQVGRCSKVMASPADGLESTLNAARKS